MSLVIFVFGIILFYYLFVTYFEKSPAAQEKSSRKASKKKRELENITPLDEKQGKENVSKLNLFFKKLYEFKNELSENNSESRDPFVFRAFLDRFKSYEDIVTALHRLGLEHCNLVLGIDFTESNIWQGKSTNKGHSLHHIGHGKHGTNPYQRVIEVLGHTMQSFITADTKVNHKYLKTASKFLGNAKNASNMSIPCFGFGDSITKDHSVFPLKENGEPCYSFSDVMSSYKSTVARVTLGGPTNFAPIINKTISIVKETKRHHLLVIVADGQLVDEKPSAQAVVDASLHPLSIVVVGVGDGPWDALEQFDDWLPRRKFDNFQFVEYERVAGKCDGHHHGREFDLMLALNVLMEVPDQYKACRHLGMLPNESEGG